MITRIYIHVYLLVGQFHVYLERRSSWDSDSVVLLYIAFFIIFLTPSPSLLLPFSLPYPLLPPLPPSPSLTPFSLPYPLLPPLPPSPSLLLTPFSLPYPLLLPFSFSFPSPLLPPLPPSPSLTPFSLPYPLLPPLPPSPSLFTESHCMCVYNCRSSPSFNGGCTNAEC